MKIYNVIQKLSQAEKSLDANIRFAADYTNSGAERLEAENDIENLEFSVESLKLEIVKLVAEKSKIDLGQKNTNLMPGITGFNDIHNLGMVR